MASVKTEPLFACHIPAVPVAQPRQSHRIVKAGGREFVHNFTSTRHPVNDFKATVRMAAETRHAGPPVTGALEVSALFVMPRPMNRRWKRREMPREHHTKRPDVDNLTKSLLDALSGLLWVDDTQIASLHASKVIASGDEQPHVELEVREL